MGVDVKVYLPGNTRLDTVCDVIARLLDAPVEKNDLDSRDHPGAWYARPAEGVVKFYGYDNLPGMAGVTLRYIDPKITGQKAFGFSYHFEFGGSKGRGDYRGIIMRSWACNIVLCKRLVDFFGGYVDYQDCDDIDVDYNVKPKSDKLNCPEDGDEWQDLQERIMAVQPITQEELNDAERHAAYKESEEDRATRLKAKRTPIRKRKRYKVTGKDGKFWAFDTKTQRRLRPALKGRRLANEDAWTDREDAQDQVDRLNREDSDDE